MPNPLYAFISCSYGSDDERVVEAIAALIRARGNVVPIIVDRMAAQEQLRETILSNIEKCDFVIAIATLDESNESRRTKPWIVSEIGIAAGMKKEVVILRDERVDQNSLGIGSACRAIEFKYDRPISNGSLILQQIESAAAIARLRVRIVRDLDATTGLLRDRVILVEPHTKGIRDPLKVRELEAGTGGVENSTDERIDGSAMGWDIYRIGIKELYEQLNPPQALGIEFFAGVNHTGGLMASEFDGRMWDKNENPIGIIKTGQRQIGGLKRKFYNLWMPRPDKVDQGSLVVLTDSQLKTGATMVEILKRLDSPEWYKDKDVKYLHALVIATHIRTDRMVYDGNHIHPMEDLCTNPINGNDPLPKHRPDFLAFVSQQNIKPPYRLP